MGWLPWYTEAHSCSQTIGMRLHAENTPLISLLVPLTVFAPRCSRSPAAPARPIYGEINDQQVARDQ